MKQKMLSLIMCLCLLFTMAMTSATAYAIASPGLDLTNSVVLSDTATSIDETGANLIAPQNSVSPASTLTNDVVISTASVKNEAIEITGTANGTPFNISGIFCSISENGNVVVFNATDSTDNFRVVYCAVEKELDKASLYFDSFSNANPEYNVVTKLYLAPNSDIHGQYIMTELYGNEFPSISPESIAALSEDHQLNLFWYAKEFKPTSTDEQLIDTRAGNPAYNLLEIYEYKNLGMTYQHGLQYRELCDIRDVTHNQSSTASATLEVTQKWVNAELENDCSDTYSTLSLKNISIGYFTMPNTAVTNMKATGEVTRSGSLTADYTFKLGVNIHGPTIPTTAYLSWTPGSKNYNAGTLYDKLNTNSGNNYLRDAVAEVNSSYFLDNIGNHINVAWHYASYSDTPSTGSAKLVFSFGVDNQLDYTQYKPIEHMRSIKVNVT